MNLFPKNPKFFDMFEELAHTLQKTSSFLIKIHSDQNRLSFYAKKIQDLEHKADAICHRLTQEAEQTFITPIDREDIHLLANSLDNIIDYIEDISSKLLFFNKKIKHTKESRELITLIHKASTVIAALVGLMQYRDRYHADMKRSITKIHTLEHDGDVVFRSAMKNLFTKEKNPITIIQWKDLYENLELIMDECEKTADIISIIIIKNF